MADGTPEERLARIEAELDAMTYQVRAFGPTATRVERLVLLMDEVREDVREIRDTRREVVRHLENQILACGTANGELRKLWEQEKETREAERKQDKQERKQFLRNLFLAFVGGMFTILAVVVAALV